MAGTTTRLLRHELGLRWTMQSIYAALTLPPGFSKVLRHDQIRIEPSGRAVDQELPGLADRLGGELPKGCRLECYAGRIVVSGRARLDHFWTAVKLDRLLTPVALARGWWVASDAPVIVPHLRQYVVPDLAIVRADGPTFDDASAGRRFRWRSKSRHRARPRTITDLRAGSTGRPESPST